MIDTLYTNQYMQNVRAPYTESNDIYKGYYKSGLIDSTFAFRIPYYKNMPSETTLGNSGSEDATLKSLSVSGCSLMPSFTVSALNYTCNVEKSVTSVNIAAQATNTSASVTGTGTVDLNSDEKNIDIVVTAGNQTTKQTYTIKVRRLELSAFTPDEIMARVGINNNSGILSGYNLGTSTESIASQITSAFPSSNVTASKAGPIGTGATITINNNGSKTYTLLVYGDNNGDGSIDILDLLRTQKHIIGVNKLFGTQNNASDVNKDGVVDILDLLVTQKHILNINQIKQ